MPFSIRTGYYTGDGNDDRSITVESGFQPDLVITIPDDSDYPMYRSSSRIDGKTAYFANNTSPVLNCVQLLEANGFQLGSSVRVNQSGILYNYAAIRFSSDDSKAGTYTGDGNDDRDLTGVGFDPACVWTKFPGNRQSRCRPDSLAGDFSLSFYTAAQVANNFQALISDGFQLGSALEVNQNTIEFHYIAMKNVASAFACGSYTGDGNDDRSIAVGFQPKLVIVKSIEAYVGYIRVDTMAADEAKGFGGGSGYGSNTIQDFEANGFQVGSNNNINRNNKVFHWIAWAEPTGAGFPVSRLAKGLVSGYHVFQKQYVEAKNESLLPLKLPDGTLW